MRTIKTSIRFKDEDVEVNALISIESDGIGHYECHGIRGYHEGSSWLECDDILPIFTDEPEEYRTELNKFIDDNFEALSVDVCKRIEEQESLDYEPEN